MNEDYAVEPAAFSNSMELKYLLEKFGFSEGRFISRYPKRWTKLVYEQLGALPDVERKRAVVLLEKYKEKCLVPCQGQYDPELVWLDNAANLLDRASVEGVIVSPEHAGRFPSIGDVDDEYFKVSRSATVPATAAQFSRLASRLIALSHEVVMIDPFFDIAKERCRKVLREFMAVALCGRCEGFVAFSRASKCAESVSTFGEYDGIVATEFRKEIDRGCPLTLVLVDDRRSKREMHKRYLLSWKGALEFDKGFQEQTGTKFAVVSTVAPNVHSDLCDLFLQGSHDFEVEERFVWA